MLKKITNFESKEILGSTGSRSTLWIVRGIGQIEGSGKGDITFGETDWDRVLDGVSDTT